MSLTASLLVSLAISGVPQHEVDSKEKKVTDSSVVPLKVPKPVNKTQLRQLLLDAVAEADHIADDQARRQAQWELVTPMAKMGLRDEAFQQAMKLRSVATQTCIYSLTTIAKASLAAGNVGDVEKAWDAARQANRDSGGNFDHYVIELGFKLDRPLQELLTIAKDSKREQQQFDYRDIRNQLAWRGRVDEAYAITEKYLGNSSRDLDDREIAYYCSSAKHYDYFVKHNHFAQAIRIIEKMPKGEHRAIAVGQLIDGLLYVANKDVVPADRIALAEKWADQIQDRVKQGIARAKIMRARNADLNIIELEQQFAEVKSREEKEFLLRKLFDKHLEQGRFEQADAILSRKLQLINEQPRPETKSKFGNFNDEDAIRIETWTHNRNMILALIKADRKDEARARLEAIKSLPDHESLYWELDDFDAVEMLVAAIGDPAQRVSGTINMAARMMHKGQFDRGWKHIEPLLHRPAESVVPANQSNLYFWAKPYADLAAELFKENRLDDATRLLSQVPESKDTGHVFESFGELLVSSGHIDELDQRLAQLPHTAARTYVRMGAIRELTKLSEESQNH